MLPQRDSPPIFKTPSNWRKPGIFMASAVRVSLADAAIAVGTINSTTSQLDGEAFHSLSLGNTTLLKQGVRLFIILKRQETDAWVTMSIQDSSTYAAYKDPPFLHRVPGVNEPKNFTLQAQYEGRAIAQFSVEYIIHILQLLRLVVRSGNINTLPTAGLLAESTENATYLGVAQMSATFIHSHLISPEIVVIDTVSALNGDASQTPCLFRITRDSQ
ncbi:hypothetical protein C8J56DRAFT_1060571 [Mycena floridula]|nr:hypothetical protein C8J56DRAFT_1060571 [Mycena floridula]